MIIKNAEFYTILLLDLAGDKIDIRITRIIKFLYNLKY